MIWLVFGVCLVGLIVCVAGNLMIIERGKVQADETHSIEIYHGCWHSTYHTVWQIRMQTVFLVGMAVFLGAMIISGLWMG